VSLTEIIEIGELENANHFRVPVQEKINTEQKGLINTWPDVLHHCITASLHHCITVSLTDQAKGHFPSHSVWKT
jgi:hypothetical protein